MPALEKGRVSFKEKKVIFIRLFSGYMAQVVPFAFLAFYASSGQFRIPARRLAVMTAALICGLAAAFAGAGVYLRKLLPPDLTLFGVVNLVFCVSLLPCLIFYLATVNAPWQKKLFVLSFTITGGALAATIGNTIVDSISIPGPSDGLPYRSWELFIHLISAVFIVILLFFVIKYFYLPVSARISPAENTYLSILSILSDALMCVLVIGFTTNEYYILYKTSLFLYISLIVTELVIFVVIFKIIAVSQEKLAVQQEVDQARSLLALQEEQYRRISDNIENSRRMRHDLRHHMVAIQGYLKEGKAEWAAGYVENYLNTTAQNGVLWLCGNHIVNAVVGHYQALSAEWKIAFTAQISVPDTFAIQNEDIAVLLGNLLENAIEAADTTMEKRYIQFKMVCSANMLAITIDNGFGSSVKVEGGHYVTTKGQHLGIGLQSVAAIAEKYSGFAEFSHQEDVFHTSVMLNLPHIKTEMGAVVP